MSSAARISNSEVGQHQWYPRPRCGLAHVWAAITLPIFLAFVALAVDVGYICVVRTQLQVAADAGALAAATTLYAQAGLGEADTYDGLPQIDTARLQARDAVSMNAAGGLHPVSGVNSLQVDLNLKNSRKGEIVVGRLDQPDQLFENITPDLSKPNAVQVQVLMQAGHPNGKVRLFFARALGMLDTELMATATATTVDGELLPIATSVSHWNTLRGGGNGDQYSYAKDGTVGNHSDGTSELFVFPGDWDGSSDLPPGNFGIVDIGPESGSSVTRRQIEEGPSRSEFQHHGGSISSGDSLSGKTGIRASMESAFLGDDDDDDGGPGGILGQVRYMPLYKSVSGTGTNATFVIAEFVAVRVMDAQLNGNPKFIAVQPVHPDDMAVRLAR